MPAEEREKEKSTVQKNKKVSEVYRDEEKKRRTQTLLSFLGPQSPGTKETENSQAQKEPEIDGEQPDWDKIIREHRNTIVQEDEGRTENVETEKEREQSWELYRLCKNFLEEKSEAWRTRKIQREHEKNRQERLEKA